MVSEIVQGVFAGVSIARADACILDHFTSITAGSEFVFEIIRAVACVLNRAGYLALRADGSAAVVAGAAPVLGQGNLRVQRRDLFSGT